MTKPISTEAIEKETKISWGDWVAFLDNAGGRDLPHPAIASLARDKCGDGWWAQSIAVAYEQHIGRRAPGQRSDGTFEASVSKTLSGTPESAMDIWLKYFGDTDSIDGIKLASAPTSSQTDKRSHWAVSLADGSRLNIDTDTYGKPAGKAGLTVTHAKLASADDTERWKAYWKSQLAELG